MKKRFKKFLFLSLFCLVLFVSAACSGTLYVGCVRSSTTTKKEATYSRFNGEDSYTFTAKQEALPFTVNVKITTEEGRLSVAVYQKENEENRPYQGSDLQTCEFSVTISESGKYVISLQAEDHKGGYSFSWE